jgi:benzoyl-CoA reductase/2-hydroxyglutaryl-CoA dehydratase subunit BcrC/BadD/HgdB
MDMDFNKLTSHLKERPVKLETMKKDGIKIVGYFPGNYVPEELIYASGAVPICFANGGDSQSAEAGLAEVPHLICPFARAQIGERILGRNPYYGMLDMFVAPITCQHLRKVAEIWEYQGGLEILKLGIPQQHENDFEVAYYADRLKVMKQRLETLTGNEITREKLEESIRLFNRMKALFKEISLTRRLHPSLISAMDFVKLNHASFLADPVFMVEMLGGMYRELNRQQSDDESKAPRILLIGPNISDGDYKVLELVESAGGETVVEEICEGIRYYWNEIGTEGDLYESLTKGYLLDRVPCAYMSYSTRKRFEFVQELIKDFNVAGVIWYELLCCETYDSEAFYFGKRLQEQNIPFLILESDYGAAPTGQLKIRIEAFIEILKGVI